MEEEMLEAVDYWIIEPFPALRRRQEQVLEALKTKIRWVDDLDALPVFEGIHFSNELLDAFPFHLIRSNGDRWEELCVAAQEDRLVFEARKTGVALTHPVHALPQRVAGTIAELRPAAGEWIHALARRMSHGFVLIIDYGFSRDDLLAPHRRDGTYRCHKAHRRDSRPLEEPGEKDISAHVDFTALAESALEAGFRIEGFTDQHHYLVGASQDLLSKLNGLPDDLSQKRLRALQTLLHPESMGRQFQYLALLKGVEAGPKLSGFRFARDPQRRLF
jgi:SAM-dependent MidA family methyltransferase